MKKLFAVLLTLALATALISCAKSEPDAGATPPVSSPSPSETGAGPVYDPAGGDGITASTGAELRVKYDEFIARGIITDFTYADSVEYMDGVEGELTDSVWSSLTVYVWHATDSGYIEFSFKADTGAYNGCSFSTF